MNKFYSLFILSLLPLFTHAETIAQLNNSQYIGWEYTRQGYTLNSDLISRNKLTLFHSSQGEDFTLLSPTLTVSDYSHLNIYLYWITPTYAHERYELYRTYPTIEILNPAGQVLAQTTLTLPTTLPEHKLETNLAIPAGVQTYRLRFAAWNGNTDNPGVVKSVTVSTAHSAIDDIRSHEPLSVRTGPNTLVLTSSEANTVFIYGIDGTLQHHLTLNPQQPTTLALPSGLYIVATSTHRYKVTL